MRRGVATGFIVGHAGLDLNGFQKTLRSCATLSGIGVHSGKPVTMRFNPADADTGIVFVPVGAEAVSRSIPALVSEIGSTALCTVLGRGPRVATVEHVMAALYGLGIDNALVEIDAGLV